MYPNLCAAQQAGVDIPAVAKCAPPSSDYFPCGDTFCKHGLEYCLWLGDECSDGQNSCVPVPDNCQNASDPCACLDAASGSTDLCMANGSGMTSPYCSVAPSGDILYSCVW